MKTHGMAAWYIDQIRKILFSEYLLWLFAGVLVSARFLIAYSNFPFGTQNLSLLFEGYYFEMLLGVLLAIFPFVYFQIFGESPLQSIRNRRNDRSKQSIVISGAGNVVHLANEDQSSRNENVQKNETNKNATQLLVELAGNAEALANKIYIRSGVYLIFGVLIAFSGIFYFSVKSISISSEDDVVKSILVLAPRFGILFFIEFIAFFFLKQYRAAMDEFRHYDAIKRNRESQLAIYLMAKNDFSEKDFKSVVERINFFEQIGKLSAGETTELLELSKLNKNELETLKELITELAKRGKDSAK